MNPLLEKITLPLIPLTVAFTSVSSQAEPVIDFNNDYLGRAVTLDCAERKTDMCSFGFKADAMSGQKPACTKTDLKNAAVISMAANVQHGAEYHKEDCIGQHSRNTLIHIYNTAREVALGNNVEKNLSNIGKFINGELGGNGGLKNMLKYANNEVSRERLDNPDGLINLLEKIIPVLENAHKNKDMNTILKTIPPAITGENQNLFNGKCTIFQAIKACNAAESELTK